MEWPIKQELHTSREIMLAWYSSNKQIPGLHQLGPLRSRPALRSKHIIRQKSLCEEFLQDLLHNLSLHGLPHIASQNRFLCERVLWGIVVLCAGLATAITGYNSWLAYRHPTVTTTVVTTRNDCANFPFPSLTICDSSRVDWLRARNLTQEDIPGEKNVSLHSVMVLLRALADMTFGDFDFMDILSASNISSSEFGQMDIAKLLQKVQRPCKEVFTGLCWWRENYHDCCDLFEVQRTDLGYCYSFNQDLSELSENYSRGYGAHGKPNFWVDWNGEVRPRRASVPGPWNGLRFTFQVMSPDQLPTGTNITPGAMIYLEESRSFPNSENQHIDPGTFVEFRVYGVTLQSKSRVRNADFEDRKCLFNEERTGWGGIYSEHNCLAQCEREYSIAYCNCSTNFFFVDDNFTKYPPCDVKGLNCLKKYNLIFNAKVPRTGSREFFQSQKKAMVCDCPPDCNSQQYLFDTSISYTQNLTNIEFDVHYRGKYNILYTADVLYGALEFLVAIGGLAGLFLGGSLLTGVELIYIFTFRFFYLWRKSRKAKTKLSPTLVLPDFYQ